MWWVCLLLILQIFWMDNDSDVKSNNVTVCIRGTQVNGKRIEYNRNELFHVKDTMTNSVMFNKLPYNAIRSIRQLGLNKRKTRRRKRQKIPENHGKGVNHKNLITVEQMVNDKIMANNLRIGTINARSLKNKVSLIFNYVLEKSLDVTIVTETWLSDEDICWWETTEFVTNGFSYFYITRPERRGGGVMILLHPKLQGTLVAKKLTSSCESVIVKLNHKIPITICGIYHPPSGSIQENTNTKFNDDITDLLTEYLPYEKNWLISGDFNINLNDCTSAEVMIFKDTMEALGLCQHVTLGGSIIEWFKSYLSPRSFKVCINNTYSETKDLTFSVPQGSASGAYIFLCYASPIKDIIPNGLTLNGFADDHSVRHAFKAGNLVNETSTKMLMEECMIRVKNWMTSMRLKLNDSKTEFIVFGSRQQLLKLNLNSIDVNGCTVHSTSMVKYLGSWLDERLSFKFHIARKCQSAMSNLFKVRNIRNFLTRDACVTVVLGLVISHLDYNNALLYGLPDTDINKLQRVQNIASKIICQKTKYESSKDCLKELHWLPIRARIDHKILSITHGCVYGYGPNYLKELISVKKSTRSLRGSEHDGLTLNIPFTKYKTFGDRSFSMAAPKLWNNLPENIRNIDSKTSFKRAIKTVLFKKYFT